MKFCRFFVLFLIPALASAASKEMIELMRDVSQIQEQIRLLQQSFENRMGQIQTLADQSLQTSNRTASSLGDLQRGITAGNSDLGRQVAQPVAALNSKIEGISQDVQGLQQTIADQNARMAKMQQQLVDLLNVIKSLQTPAAPPPSTDGVSSAPGTSPGTTAGMPPVSAAQLYQNAVRDNNGGNVDLALTEFTDYLKYYRSTDLAPNAQFYIGDIHYRQRNLEQAVTDFDQVLEAFPINPKTPDAHYMKGRALFQLGQRNEAAKEFRAVMTQFPNSSVAPQCAQSLKALGLNASAPAPVTRKKR